MAPSNLPLQPASVNSMKRVIPVVVAWTLFSVFAYAQLDPSKDVEAVEHARMAAVERRDVDAVARFLTDDFTSVGTSGRQSSKQQYLDGLRANPAPVRMQHEDVVIRIYSSTALITGRSTVTRAADGSPVSLTRYTHVYIRQGNEWKMAAMQNSPVAPQ